VLEVQEAKNHTAVAIDEVQSVTALLGRLVRAQRSLHQYGKNEVSDQHEAELFQTVETHLERFGPIRLTVHDGELHHGDAVVHEDHEPRGLTSTLFLNGVRRLSFLPGLERSELHDLLSIANHVGQFKNERDDMVTLMWDRGFESIAYVVVDELPKATDSPRIEELLESGTLGVGGDDEAVLIRPSELEQPVSRLPLQSIQFEEGELDAFHDQLAAEESIQGWRALVELTAELVLLEEETEQRELGNGLVHAIDRLIDREMCVFAVLALDHLVTLCRGTFCDEREVQALRVELTLALAEPARLTPILGHVERDRVDPALLTSFLVELGAPAIPPILRWMAVAPDSDWTRAACDAIAAAGPEALAEITSDLGEESGSDTAFVRELLNVLERRPPAATLPILEALLRHPSPETRLDVAWSLGPCDAGPTGGAWLSLLDDPDPRIFQLAVGSIVKSMRPELTTRLLDLTTTPAFRGPPRGGSASPVRSDRSARPGRSSALAHRAAVATLLCLVPGATQPPARPRGRARGPERRHHTVGPPSATTLHDR